MKTLVIAKPINDTPRIQLVIKHPKNKTNIVTNIIKYQFNQSAYELDITHNCKLKATHKYEFNNDEQVDTLIYSVE